MDKYAVNNCSQQYQPLIYNDNVPLRHRPFRSCLIERRKHSTDAQHNEYHYHRQCRKAELISSYLYHHNSIYGFLWLQPSPEHPCSPTYISCRL